MSRGKKNDSGRPKAKSVARYTIYNVTESAELMDFLMRWRYVGNLQLS